MQTGTVVGGKYRLGPELGRGAHGVVHRAVDSVTGADVAVKLAHHGARTGALRMRSEAALLGLLRLPGIVTYRDHGTHERRPFLVLDLVEGTPFPGASAPLPWERLAPVLRTLLETLARLHFHGVAHRDLKPSNVLVDDAGRVHVLDFGLARAPATTSGGDGAPQWSGSPAYVAPERVDRSLSVAGCDAVQEDLYAVGVMAFEALSGAPPHPGATPAEVLTQRLDHPAPPLSGVADGVSPAVATTIDRLLAIDPADRPSSAGEAIQLLFADEDARARPRRLRRIGRKPGQEHEPLDAAEIRAFVAGPDRVLHLREDTAAELLRRTGGDPRRVDDEIGIWLRAGRAAWVDDRLVVTRRALDALRAEPVTEAAGAPHDGVTAWVSAQLRSGAGSAAFVAEAPRIASQLVDDGRAAEAVELLRRAIRTARSESTRDGLPALLSALAFAALAARTPLNLGRALQEFATAPEAARPSDASRAMLEAARLIPTRGASSLSRLRSLPEQSDAALESRRRALIAEAASRHGIETHGAVLDELERAAEESGDARAAASCATWRAFFHYRLGAFDEAARLHLRSASSAPSVTARLAAYGNAAAALLEAGAWDHAEQAARRSRDLAAECRNAHYEARAECLLRCVAYRRGSAAEADLELVDAVEALADERYLPTMLLTEAAVAWRTGAERLALDLSERTATACRGPSDRWCRALARALSLRLGATPAEGEVRELLGAATECPLPGVALQIAGLVPRQLAGGHEDRLTAIASRASELARDTWSRRREVLSIDEALDALEAATT